MDAQNTHHNRKDTLFHFTSVLSSQNNHLHTLEVDLNRSRRAHTLGEPVGGELASVVDNKIGLAEIYEFLLGGADQHVILLWLSGGSIRYLDWNETYHEQSMIGTSAYDSNLNAVFRIPLL